MSTRLQEDLTAANSTIRIQQKKISALEDALYQMCKRNIHKPDTKTGWLSKKYWKQFGLGVIHKLEVVDFLRIGN